jgi:N-acetylglucosaminyldiphosphoundecaprenol N-acetyl-beta-D-mannosaminyltransferase
MLDSNVGLGDIVMKSRSEKRIEFLGCPLDCMTSTELLEELAVGIVQKQPPRVIQFVNANKVAMVRHDSTIGAILRRADYVLADGQPMLPMAALLGWRVPERIDGIGLMQKLLGLAQRRHFSVYLLGARQDVLDECVRRIREDFPGLDLAGWHHGYFSEAEIPAIAAEIRAKAPDFLFLGLGSPMKERLADEWREQLGARVIQGVGGSFDVIAGMVKRAPMWMQRCGMEWLYRIIQEPRRMFWRYVKTNGACLWVFSVAFWKRWRVPSRHVPFSVSSRDPLRTELPIAGSTHNDSSSGLPDVPRESPCYCTKHAAREVGNRPIYGSRKPSAKLRTRNSRIRRVILPRYRKAGRIAWQRQKKPGR